MSWGGGGGADAMQFHINRGNRVSHFNASLTDEGGGGVARQWPEATTFEEKGEPTPNRTDVPSVFLPA